MSKWILEKESFKERDSKYESLLPRLNPLRVLELGHKRNKDLVNLRGKTLLRRPWNGHRLPSKQVSSLSWELNRELSDAKGNMN